MNKDLLISKIDLIIEYLIYITIFALPLSIGLFNISLSFTFLLFLIRIMIERNFSIKLYNLDKAILIFSFVLILSIFNSYNKVRSMDFIISPFLKYIVLYLAVTRFLNQKEKIVKTIKIYWVSTFVSAGYVLYLGYFSNVIRPTGFTHNSNRLGILMSIFITINYILILFSKNNKYRTFSLAGLVFGLPTLMLTQSRGALLALILSLLILSIIKDKKSIFLFILFTILLLFVLPQNFKLRLSQLANLQSRNVKQRFLMYKAGYQVLKNNWILGIGINNIAETYSRFDFSFLTKTYRHWHNILLNVIVEMGTLGFIAFLNLIYVTVKNFMKNFKSKNIISIFSFGVFLNILFQNMVSLTLDGSEVGLTFVFFISLQICILNNDFEFNI
ncbi:MAG: O-antigen ligase family protein [Bacillota bacterium]